MIKYAVATAPRPTCIYRPRELINCPTHYCFPVISIKSDSKHLNICMFLNEEETVQRLLERL